MAGRVEFSEENSIEEDSLVSRGKYIRFSLIRLMKRLRLVRTDAQANNLLMWISAILFVLAVMTIIYFGLGIGRINSTRYYIPNDLRSTFPPEVQQRINAS